LLHVSGIHGVEGHAGSAIQLALLDEYSQKSYNENPTTIFVHLLNPYGFDKSRKFNENNVDLSRNLLTKEEFVEMMQREPDKYGYATLDHVINPKRVMHWYNELIYWPRALWEIFM